MENTQNISSNTSNTNKDKANKDLLNAISVAQQNNFSRQEDWEKIKKSLENGADPNYKIGEDATTVIMLAAQYLNKNLCYYLLERGADVNARDMLGRTALSRVLKTLCENRNFDIQICEKLLQHGANPNIITNNKFIQTPLSLAAYYGRGDLVTLLITYNADVNQKDKHFSSPLEWTIYRSKFFANMNLPVIKKLLNARASLFNVNGRNETVFHTIVGRPHDLIKTIITCARFDDNSYAEIIDAQQDKHIKETIMETLIILKLFGIPLDLQLHILSKLPMNHFYYANGGLCQALSKSGYRHPFISAQVNKRIRYLHKILKISGKEGTPLARLHKRYPYLMAYRNNVEQLFDESKLKQDMENFLNNKEILEDNLIYQMYRNCTKILEKEEKQNKEK